MEAVQAVENEHVKRSGGFALLTITADVEVAVVVSAIDQSMDQCRVPVVREDYGLVLGEDRVELIIRDSSGVFSIPLGMGARQSR